MGLLSFSTSEDINFSPMHLRLRSIYPVWYLVIYRIKGNVNCPSIPLFLFSSSVLQVSLLLPLYPPSQCLVHWVCFADSPGACGCCLLLPLHRHPFPLSHPDEAVTQLFTLAPDLGVAICSYPAPRRDAFRIITPTTTFIRIPSRNPSANRRQSWSYFGRISLSVLVAARAGRLTTANYAMPANAPPA